MSHKGMDTHPHTDQGLQCLAFKNIIPHCTQRIKGVDGMGWFGFTKSSIEYKLYHVHVHTHSKPETLIYCMTAYSQFSGSLCWLPSQQRLGSHIESQIKSVTKIYRRNVCVHLRFAFRSTILAVTVDTSYSNTLSITLIFRLQVASHEGICKPGDFFAKNFFLLHTKTLCLTQICI